MLRSSRGIPPWYIIPHRGKQCDSDLWTISIWSSIVHLESQMNFLEGFCWASVRYIFYHCNSFCCKAEWCFWNATFSVLGINSGLFSILRVISFVGFSFFSFSHSLFAFVCWFFWAGSVLMRTGSTSISCSSKTRVPRKAARFHGFKDFFWKATDVLLRWVLDIRNKRGFLTIFGYPHGLSNFLTCVMWMHMDYSEPEWESMEGRKRVSGCVLKYSSPHPVHVQHISVHSSRTLGLAVAVCVWALKAGS